MKAGTNPKARPPMRSEIGRIVYEEYKIKVEVKDKRGNPSTQEKPGFRFWLCAIGPTGRYTSCISRPFEGKSSSDRHGWYIVWSEAAKEALDGLIQDLWKEGWQPTSFGRVWHDINFRRVVPEPAESESAPAQVASQSSRVEAQSAPASVGALSDAFRQVEAAYKQLRADFAAGRLHPDKYRAALQKLTVKDASGRQWAIEGKSGKWIVWNGKAWQWANPLK